MYNFFFRINCFILASIITVFSLSFTYLQADSQNDNENSKPFSLVIDIPSENIKKIPILGYNLVYLHSHASLVDFLDDQIESFIKNLNKIGIKPQNIVIIYTNYVGYSQPITDPTYPIKDDSTLAPVVEKYTTKEGVTLNLTNLVKKYSLPFLITPRAVIIGSLIDDNFIFKGNEKLKVAHEFNIPNATGFTYYIPPSPESDKEENNTKKEKSIYSYESLVAQRASMIQYMNLGLFKKTSFIGMMEYKDLVNNSYTYFALPGNLHDLLYPSNKTSRSKVND